MFPGTTFLQCLTVEPAAKEDNFKNKYVPASGLILVVKMWYNYKGDLEEESNATQTVGDKER